MFQNSLATLLRTRDRLPPLAWRPTGSSWFVNDAGLPDCRHPL